MKLTHKQGIAALDAGDFSAAITYFEAAVRISPDSGAVRYDLARALHRAGREGEAIIQASQALARDPGDNSAARLLAYLLCFLRLRNPGEINPVGLTAAFGFTNIDHQFLVPMALAYLKQHTALRDALVMAEAHGEDVAAAWLLSPKGKSVLRDPLLLATLSSAANTDIDIERLLTALRKAVLVAPARNTLRKPYILEFARVLARQSEINEYVFAVSAEEQDRLDQIFINVEGVRNGSRAAVECLLLRALYAPLWRLLGTEGKNIDGQAIRPKSLGNFIAAHMAERRADANTAQEIISLGDIGDTISRNVALQYEENPYPRWLSLHIPAVGDRKESLSPHFTGEELAFMDAPYKVLIAGAGTGQQAIDAALGYGPMAALTAIDISLSSLAYAKRMVAQFGVTNLQFVLCDILNAGLLKETFDIIECIGVLHHMDDPWRGWKALLDTLRPGGIFKIGLYSRTSRRVIASLRDDIKARNLASNEQTIRAYRQDIIAKGNDGKGAFLRQSADFYSLSNFRDLMFHVSEQHMTIPEISSFLADNNLTFQGFQVPPNIAEGHPDGDTAQDLDLWREFENAHPDTFDGMYVFWCRKG